MGKGEFESAANSLKKAIELAPDRLQTYVLLGMVVANYQSRPQEARQWYDKLTQRNPKRWQAHLDRGVYLATVNAVDEASPRLLNPWN